MAVTGVRYNLETGAIIATYAVRTREELALNFQPATEGMLEVPGSHAVLFQNARDWNCLGGVLTYSPQAIPKPEPAPDLQDYLAALVDEINVSRQALNLKALTLTELIDSAKAKMEAAK